MAKVILAVEDRLNELDQSLVKLEKEERSAAIVVAVCGGGTIMAFLFSVLWIF